MVKDAFLTIAIPTFNRRDRVTSLVESILRQLEPDDELIVIDDGSPDGTAQIVRDLKHQHPTSLFLEERRGKMGLGTAYIYGFKWAIERGYAFIFEMDADF